MAKQRQQFTGENAFDAIVNMCNIEITKEAKNADNPEQYVEQMTGLLNQVTHSNMRTMTQLQDDTIEQYHQINEAQVEAQEQADAEELAEAQETIARLTKQPEQIEQVDTDDEGEPEQE